MIKTKFLWNWIINIKLIQLISKFYISFIVLFLFPLLILTISSCSNGGNKTPDKTAHDNKETSSFTVILPERKTINLEFVLDKGEYNSVLVNKYPHQRTSFTQGLEYIDGFLYESTGMVGTSEIMKCEIETGKVLKRRSIPGLHFGEGLTVFGNRIYQLTWQSGVCFVWDKESFELINSHNYSGEGWGLTNDGEILIMSGGDNVIRFIDPETFKVERTISVFDENYPVKYLNELEWVNGEIWANVWQKDIIYRIDPESGKLLGKIDISHLYKHLDTYDNPDVLNGIAYDADSNRIFVTGKYWPYVFEIKPVKK